jgi:hypothetical protein
MKVIEVEDKQKGKTKKLWEELSGAGIAQSV